MTEAKRGHQVRVNLELIGAIKAKFPYLSMLKTRAIVEIALGRMLIDRGGINPSQTVIQVPLPQQEKVRVDLDEEDLRRLDYQAAQELERELEQLIETEADSGETQ